MAHCAVLGLGEAGSVVTEDLLALGHEVAGYDIACGGLALADAVSGADLVVSAVTPGRCVDAARSAAGALDPGAWYFDLNSSSPEHKREAEAAVTDAGGRYVEAALMSAIAPARLASPFLLGGRFAEAFATEAATFGLTDVTVVPGPLGTAAATKLCRSVLVKGLEALVAESLLAARSLGVERAVLESLPNLLPDGDWDQRAGYFLERALRHGARRAEEMQEAAHTVAGAGIDPVMARATEVVQRRSGALAIEVPTPPPSTTALLDMMLEETA